ncbi:dipeptide ABC transporter ATP-binding protein [Bosea sp. (in: a-proteobacteria)]|jgi:peptide/nickel transport system ATP-binding protein|uniref:dipeptide ABC transporter ATP-binding protein n=1 Tax=Bosea sp. (in: a-proteobacteria) TaxID=1871050 RepID=UPI003F71723D
MSAPALEVKGLSVSFAADGGRTRVLHEVDMTVGRGRALGVVGESGSGKSTAALAVLGLLDKNAAVDAGHVLLDGEDLYAKSDEERRALRGGKVSIVFQDPFTTLNPAIRVGKQIAEPLIMHRGMSEAQARAETLKLLSEVGIPDPARMAASYPHQLSGGMKQRALIASALACEPDLLILDEPTTALDVTVEAQILDLLDELRRKRDLSLLFISHNLGVVSRICDDICVLYAGRVVEQGRTDTVLSQPRHPYTKGLLASLPALSVERRRLEPIPGRLPDARVVPAGCVFAPRCHFATARCEAEPQQLLAQDNGSRSRCWRSAELAGTAWRSGEAAAILLRPSPPADAVKLIEAQEIERTFRSGGPLDGLSLRFDGWKPRLSFGQAPFRAVDKVSLTIHAGEIVGLVGESGSGKTTLGRCLIDLVSPSAGEVRIDGEKLLSASRRRKRELLRNAQIIFQNPDSSLNPRKPVREILARPLELLGLDKAARERRVHELLDLVRLDARYAERYPHEMSGGEKQRIGIARALATKPQFIVCDEAVSALDVSVQASILNLLLDLRDEFGLAYLFITHDLSVVSYVSDRICVMRRGEIVEQGRTEAILERPAHPYTASLLAAVPRVRQLESGVSAS